MIRNDKINMIRWRIEGIGGGISILGLLDSLTRFCWFSWKRKLELLGFSEFSFLKDVNLMILWYVFSKEWVYWNSEMLSHLTILVSSSTQVRISLTYNMFVIS